MKVNLIVSFLFSFLATSACWAGQFEVEFMAGNTSIESGVHYEKELSGGFMKIGGYGFYNNDESVENKWGVLDFTIGSDTLLTGLACEVGIAGISGDVEDNGYSGDIGAIAFAGKAGYVFTDDLLPIPFELFARITYAPQSITFGDTDNYFAYQIGLGIRIVEYASGFVKYSACDADMVSDSHTWNLKDNSIQFGLIFRL